jgi:hypothetical protein
MGRSKLSSADYIDQQSIFIGVILAELAEHAALANRAWQLAVEASRHGDLDRAMTLIIEADIDLDIPVRLERQDSRRVFRRALELLEREMPDDESDGAPES